MLQIPMKSVETAMCGRNFCKVSMKHVLVKLLKGDALQSPCPPLLKLKGNKIPHVFYPPPPRASPLPPSAPSPWPVASCPFTSTLQTTAHSYPTITHSAAAEGSSLARWCPLICPLIPSLSVFCGELHSPCFFAGLDIPQPVPAARRGRGVSHSRRHSEVGQ